MIFHETERLYLRRLEKRDLPRVTELIGDWVIVQWLTHVPYPYSLKDAEEFYEKVAVDYTHNVPGYFVMASKTDNLLMGAVGLHPAYGSKPKTDEIEVGYWLGKKFWGKGFMTEAVKAVVSIAFQRPLIQRMTSTTDPANQASQNILRKNGFDYLGLFPRPTTDIVLRGSDTVTRWELHRTKHEKGLVTCPASM